jgi:hypothetical protein
MSKESLQQQKLQNVQKVPENKIFAVQRLRDGEAVLLNCPPQRKLSSFFVSSSEFDVKL